MEYESRRVLAFKGFSLQQIKNKATIYRQWFTILLLGNARTLVYVPAIATVEQR
jgi:hypothetical protein